MKKFLAYLKEKRTVTSLLVICLAILFYMLLGNLTGVRDAIGGMLAILSPLIGGAVIAYLLDPLARWIQRRCFGKMKMLRTARVLAVVIAFVFVLAVFILLIMTMVPQVLDSLGMLLDNITYYFANAEETVSGLAAAYPVLELNVDKVMDTLQEWLNKITALMANNLDTILATSYRAGSKVFNFVLEIVMSLYILLDRENIFRSIRRWSRSRLSLETCQRWHTVLARGDKIFTGFLGGNVLDSVIIGVANFILMKIFAMPYALLISAIVGVTNFIPTFGPIIGAVPSALILLLIDPWDALWFLVFTVGLQTLDPYLIKPLLFGDVTGLRPLWVLAAVIIGGRMFGIWGMVFGIPLLAVVSQLLHEQVDKRLEARGLDCEGMPKPPEPSPAREE